VTLKGELIEKSGTMSGGGKPKTGGMSNVVVQEFTEEQIRECEGAMTTLSQQVMKLKEERPRFEEMKRHNGKRSHENSLALQKSLFELQ
jgi:structural maintenance of chromosome 4